MLNLTNYTNAEVISVANQMYSRANILALILLVICSMVVIWFLLGHWFKNFRDFHFKKTRMQEYIDKIKAQLQKEDYLEQELEKYKTTATKLWNEEKERSGRENELITENKTLSKRLSECKKAIEILNEKVKRYKTNTESELSYQSQLGDAKQELKQQSKKIEDLNNQLTRRQEDDDERTAGWTISSN